MNINTERLYLRKYEDHDEGFLMSMLSNPNVMRFIGDGHTRGSNGTRTFLNWIYRTYKRGSDLGLRVIVRKNDHVPVGHAGLVPQSIDNKEEIEVGYWIAHQFWGHGYASEIAEALKEYGKKEVGQQRLIALIQPGNVGSQSVAKKIGMEIEKEITLSGKSVLVYSTMK